MQEPTGSSSSTWRTAAASRTTDTRRSSTRRNSGGADMETLSDLSREAVTPLTGSCSAYGHNRRTAGICSALFSDSQCLFDQRLDDLRLRHGLDHLALHEDLPLAVSGRDSEVCIARLAGTVDDTAHHSNAQREVEPVQPGGDSVGKRVDVDLCAAARRARHDLESAGPQVKRFQDLGPD